jgi:hypothetical protein
MAPRSSLGHLPSEIWFVCRYARHWPDLFGPDASTPTPASVATRVKTNEECWIVLTYLHLRQAGIDNIHLVDRFVPGAICVASGLDFGIRDLSWNSYTVACRSDGPDPVLADHVIVQNPLNQSPNHHYVPHWPQPGLIPRQADRGTMIRSLVFKGDECNLWEPFKTGEFRARLRALGVELRIDGKVESSGLRWHDYRHDDLILAARDLTEEDAKVKPASKLINAWHARVPALLGPEPAYQVLRGSQLDYLEVRSCADVIRALEKLRTEPNLYCQMVENGTRRATQFSEEAIVNRWVEILSGPFCRGYAAWCATPWPFRGITRRVCFIGRALRHRRQRRQAAHHRYHGLRILSGQAT